MKPVFILLLFLAIGCTPRLQLARPDPFSLTPPIAHIDDFRAVRPTPCPLWPQHLIQPAQPPPQRSREAPARVRAGRPAPAEIREVCYDANQIRVTVRTGLQQFQVHTADGEGPRTWFLRGGTNEVQVTWPTRVDGDRILVRVGR